MSDSDLWDDAGPFLYRQLPEDCLDAFFSEERDMVQITPERDGWWMGETSRDGQTRYDSLAEAKEAGDEIVDAAEAAQDGLLLAEAGLSADEWSISYEDGPRFEQKRGNLWIVASGDEMSPRQCWDMYAGDDLIIRRERDIAKVVAAALARI